MPVGGISSLAEVMIMLRYVELRSCLFRLLSLFKVREGAFDPTIREFTITDLGIVLSGMAREAARIAAIVAAAEDGNREPSSGDPARPG